MTMLAALVLALAPHAPATVDGWIECRGAPVEGDWNVLGEWRFEKDGWLSKLDEFSQLELPHDVAEFELELAWLEADGTTAKRQRLAVRDGRAEIGDFVARERRESLADKSELIAGPVVLRRKTLDAPWHVYVLGGGRRYVEIRRRERATMAGAEVALFDRLTLTGWRALGDARYSADTNSIVGEVDGGAQSFLVTEREFGDFVLDVDVRNEKPGNSGIQVRSHVDANGHLYGCQLEIDPSARAWSGGLYDEGRRGWLDDLSEDANARAAFVVGDWNHYRIECHGPWIRAWVNGVPTANRLDPLDLSGVIGLQVHSGNDTRVRWSNFRLRALGTREWEPIELAELVGPIATPEGEPHVAWGRSDGACGLRFERASLRGHPRFYLREEAAERASSRPVAVLGPALFSTEHGCFVDLAASELASETGEPVSLLVAGSRVALFVGGRQLADVELGAHHGRFVLESDAESAPALVTNCRRIGAPIQR
ncbi:MAG: DUF1080 domain-containing protein [Planctomycetes bacterium]|nr:DUF1080 domain-containing protein [Planctomycetota bacterium]